MLAYFIRHAQSENNARRESERVADPALTEVGLTQAERLGAWSLQLELTRLISSPFLRTLQTAEQIHLATGLPAEVRPDWYEAGGCFSDYRPDHMRGESGLSRTEMQTRFPGFEISDAIDEDGWYKRPDRETYDEARRRAARLLKEVIEEFGDTDERVGFVIHCDLKLFLLEAFHDNWVGVPLNTAVTTVELSPAGASLIAFNGVEHLSESLHTY